MGDQEKSDEEPNRIMVYLRIRPAKKGEINPAEGSHYLLDVQPDHQNCLLESKTYNFDWIFDGDKVTQEEIYLKVAKPVIANVFKGFWGTVMVYGQTGTGKSFTMCNFDPKQLGIIPRAMHDMFEVIKEDTQRNYTIEFSFIQIYLDKLQDLFNPEAPELKISRDKDGVTFPGITSHVVKDEEHFRELYEDGHQHRVITATKMNPESSRGHAALFIQVKSVPKDDPSGQIRNGKLFLIDLAGYERFSKTGVQEGLMAQEAKTINGSLLALGSVVQGLSDKSEHVPWRNAKLTRMLEDAIGGKAKCSIILTAGPSSEHVHETQGTLYFGSRAKAVKTNAKMAVNVDYKSLAAKLQQMLNDAESKINTLEVEATRRQLEREEAEAIMQAEWARVKKRQEDQLKELLTSGATPEKVQELIHANQREADILEEQHYAQRAQLEERHEEEVQESLAKQKAQMSLDSEKTTKGMSQEVHVLERQLKQALEECEDYKTKWNDAKAETRRLTQELSDAKLKLETADFAGGSGNVPKDFAEKLASIKAMLEEDMELRIQEIEEPLREELAKCQKENAALKEEMEEKVQKALDSLSSLYETDLETVRRNSHEVQERLKKNHMTIKKSYQAQKERLDQEVDELTAQVDALTKQIISAGMKPVAVKVTPKKSGDLGDAPEKVKDLQRELDYVMAENEGLKKELETIQNHGDRMSSLQPTSNKEIETLKREKERVEVELFKMRAQQNMSAPEQLIAGADDDDQNDSTPDIHGDVEGMEAFIKKMLRVPSFAGAQTFVNDPNKIFSTLTSDLDDYRRFARSRVILLGPRGSGKTTFLKCLADTSPLRMRMLPEVSPTMVPNVQSFILDDPTCGKADWYKVYTQFQDLDTSVPASAPANFLTGLKDKLKGSTDNARFHLDVVDLPGDQGFWRSYPPYLLPGKNTIYCIMYDLTNTVDVARAQIEEQLSMLHACCARNYPKMYGGSAPKVSFFLMGTQRDRMRDSRDSAVQAHISKILMSIGEYFYALRGTDTFGLVCAGNFAINCRDGTSISDRDRVSRMFKDLTGIFVNICCHLYQTRPTAFLLNTQDKSSHLSFLLGEESADLPVDKTSDLSGDQKNMIKGVVTLLTALAREQNARWFIVEADLRKMVADHLRVKENDSVGNCTINFLLRELAVRGYIAPLPNCILEPKYLPRVRGKDDLADSAVAHPREGIVVIDTTRLLSIYTLFVTPVMLGRINTSLPFLRDKTQVLCDVDAFLRIPPAPYEGALTEQHALVAFKRALPYAGEDVKLLFELFSIMGLGFRVRAEKAMISPAHIVTAVSPVMTEYMPFLLSNFGDGIGMRCGLKGGCPNLLCRLQNKLMPFTLAPVLDSKLGHLNYADASFLVLDKTRLKSGTFGSKPIKDAVMAAGVPTRGLIKYEGDTLYIVVVARGPNLDASLNVCRRIVNAIQYELTGLVKREFRGMTILSQELTITGHAEKCKKLAAGVQSILSHFKLSKEDINKQLQILGSFENIKRTEIEDALRALPRANSD